MDTLDPLAVQNLIQWFELIIAGNPCCYRMHSQPGHTFTFHSITLPCLWLLKVIAKGQKRSESHAPHLVRLKSSKRKSLVKRHIRDGVAMIQFPFSSKPEMVTSALC